MTQTKDWNWSRQRAEKENYYTYSIVEGRSLMRMTIVILEFSLNIIFNINSRCYLSFIINTVFDCIAAISITNVNECTILVYVTSICRLCHTESDKDKGKIIASNRVFTSVEHNILSKLIYLNIAENHSTNTVVNKTF